MVDCPLSEGRTFSEDFRFGSAAGLREINVIAINLSVKLPRHTADDHVRQVRRYSHQESVVTGSFLASTGRTI